MLSAKGTDAMSTNILCTVVHKLNGAVGVLEDDTDCLCLWRKGDGVDGAYLPHLVGNVAQRSRITPRTDPNDSSISRVVAKLFLFLYLDGSLHCITGSELCYVVLASDRLGGSD